MIAQTPDHGQAVAIAHGAGPRSSHWPAVEKAFAQGHPNCEICNPSNYGKVKIQVHHRFAFHVCVLLGRADLEIDPRNLHSLCEDEQGEKAENHHLIVGHYLDFQVNNDNLLQDIIDFKGQSGITIRANIGFSIRVKNRPTPFPQWTLQMRLKYRAMLDEVFPPDPAILAKYFPNGLSKSSLLQG